MMQNLCDVSGSCPIIRAGGSTANRATYYPNQTEALIAVFNTPGEDQPDSVSIGPAWFESFQQFPNGTQYIFNLNFGDNKTGLDQTVLEATPAFREIGEALYAFEIGNEVDGTGTPGVHLSNAYSEQAGLEEVDDQPTGPYRATSLSGLNTLSPSAISRLAPLRTRSRSLYSRAAPSKLRET